MTRKLDILTLCLLCLLLASLFTPGATLAQNLGDLMVTPTRVLFEGRDRSARLTLVNQGTSQATYRIDFVNIRMEDGGKFVEIEEPDPGQRFADDMIRYSPRQVDLEPGESQQVRLLLRRPADLRKGEYRSHLRFQAVPSAEEAGASVESLAGEEPESISIRLTPVFGVTLPVIVRQGELEVGVELADLAIRPGPEGRPAEASFHLVRTGERSVFGDLTISFEPAAGGEPVDLAVVKGIAVYTPNDHRQVLLSLRPPEGVDLDEGTLRVTYRARTEEGGGVLTEGSLSMP